MRDNNGLAMTIGVEDEYELIGELGRGGASVVYLARERLLGREVAIKIIRERYLKDDEAIARLEREAQTLARLSHPNIVTLYGARRLPDGSIALMMQHLRGDTLRQTVRKNGPLTGERAERVLCELASALAYLHGQGIIHRDVKPENIFIQDGDGRAVLSDFGLAKGLDGLVDVTLAGSVIGTPSYMSPEQIDGSELDGRSDIYSLGLVGYELVTGAKPWEGEGLYSVIFKQKHEALPPLDEVCPGLHERLHTAITRSLAKNRDERWSSAGELLAFLGGQESPYNVPMTALVPGNQAARHPLVLPSEPTISFPVAPARTDAVPLHPASNRSGRYTQTRLAAAAVVALIFVGGSFLLYRNSPTAEAAERIVPQLEQEVVPVASAAASVPAAQPVSLSQMMVDALRWNVLLTPPSDAPDPRRREEALRTGTARQPRISAGRPQDVAASRPADMAGESAPTGTSSTPEALLPNPGAAVALLGTVEVAPGALAVGSAPALRAGSPKLKTAEAQPEPTTRPRLRNADAVRYRVGRLYSADLQSNPATGTVGVQLGIDEMGRVIGATIAASSGHAALDSAALKLAWGMKFTPAEASGKPVPASVRVPVTFSGGAP